MQRVRDTYCSYCGAKYAEPLVYPRSCAACQTQVWANPIPVAVVLVQIADGDRTGLLVVRRAIPPQIGKLALIGGFVEEHETWQAGGAREVREESGAVIEGGALEPMWYASSSPKPNRILLFSIAPAVPISALPPFVGHDHEASERGVVYGPGGLEDDFAFSLHVEAARRYFASRGVTGPHGFTPH
ncbi:MAG: NUDIX domain-containing protein [Deltaproteobacteria bacterium]|nr:NUDIX domain-containing protein [Deltaproteobacteria bacterium]MCW5802056.1 NUDIX domain-containing protein [Deltaproteobacteria bacterium]